MKHFLLIIAALLVMSVQSSGQERIDYKALRAKYPFIVPEESFRTDTVVIRGRIENYDPKTAVFNTLQCYSFDEFENQTAASMPIGQDGSFEKKIRISYPVCNSFYTYTQGQWFDIPFFAYPGDTVDIEAKMVDGKLECAYPKGRSKEVARTLRFTREWKLFAADKFLNYKDGFDKFTVAAEDFWKEFTDKVYHDGLSASFNDHEMGFALSLVQGYYAYSVLNPLLHIREDCYDKRIEGQYMFLTLRDTATYERIKDPKNYAFLSHIDFSDKAFFSNDVFWIALNRITWLEPFSANKNIGKRYPPQGVENSKKYFLNADTLLRKTLQTNNNSLTAQMVLYNDVRFFIERAWMDMPDDSIKDLRDNILPTFSFEPIRDKAAQLFAERLSNASITYPMKKCAATAFIDSLRNVYKGKYLYFDFWAMSCGPCRMTIEASKDLRKEIANNPNIKLVFVNGDHPQYKAMQEYVAKHLADEVNVAPGEEIFAALRDVFNFSGIPHFEVITPDGQVVKGNQIRFGLRESGDYKSFVQEFEKLRKKIENKL